MPVADTEVAPLPRFTASIPCLPPATAAAATLRLAPRRALRAWIPWLAPPVTDPVAATMRLPAPSFLAVTPVFDPRAPPTETETPAPVAVL